MSNFFQKMPLDQIQILRRYLQLQTENKKFPKDSFRELPTDGMIEFRLMGPPKRAFRSADFLVQEFHQNDRIWLCVCRTDIENDGNYKADISWEELQWVKDHVGYADFDAVEVYPRQRDIVNVANLRHLWIMQEPLPFVWRKKS